MCFQLHLKVVDSGQVQNILDSIYPCIYHHPLVIQLTKANFTHTEKYLFF